MGKDELMDALLAIAFGEQNEADRAADLTADAQS
jgi:hypothetical protein